MIFNRGECCQICDDVAWLAFMVSWAKSQSGQIEEYFREPFLNDLCYILERRSPEMPKRCYS